MDVKYQEIEVKALDVIEPLCEKLRKHHETRSPYFAQHFASQTWKARKTELFEKAKIGKLHTDLARDIDSGDIVGYCKSIVSANRKGCLESIFIESSFRNHGIGKALILKALSWMKDEQVQAITLEVGVGNEEVLPFYSQFGFNPRTIILQKTTK